MKVRSIQIKNFRLLQDATLELDDKTTVIVGRNNTGKTSCMTLLKQMLDGGKLSYNDCPIANRNTALQLFIRFLLGEISADDCLKEWPTTSLTFIIDYSPEGDNDNLGALAPFIIDLDDSITDAVIRVEYRLMVSDETKKRFADEILHLGHDRNNPEAIAKIKQALTESFGGLFSLKAFAVHPRQETVLREQELARLQDLIVLFSISAERGLDEDGSGRSSLRDVIAGYFNEDLPIDDASIAQKITELRNCVDNTGKRFQEETDGILNDLISKAAGFGYPNDEELQLGVTTDVSLSNHLISNSDLDYRDKTTHEKLPSNYNGLGYKNLIKIQLLLAKFIKQLKGKGEACVPLLFVEEPESHMHPQLQQRFVDYLETFLDKLLPNNNIQSIMTSHSSHVANEVDFSRIRYASRHSDSVVFKNLKAFSTTTASNADFIHKYLTLTKCDLFFADKAILVEGASERILLPDMINKCSKDHTFSEGKDLSHQYYSIIEVGGAYAHLFIPFIRFIGISCLIITDIDPERHAGDTPTGTPIYSSCNASEGEKSSNETINRWVREKHKLEPGTFVPFGDIRSLPTGDKTDGQIHLEFQTPEHGLCGKSLEEAIKNANRAHYEVPDHPSEQDVAFKEKSKTDFALNLIFKNPKYTIPEYIKRGLIWLSDQPIIS